MALIETLLEKDADQILAQCMAHEAVEHPQGATDEFRLFWKSLWRSPIRIVVRTIQAALPGSSSRFSLTNEVWKWPSKADLRPSTLFLG
jgi:hypothetical protein